MWTDAQTRLSKDRHIASLIKKWGNCKIVKKKSLKYFDDLAQAIVGQQLSGKAADTICGRVLAATEKSPTLLSPEKILETSDEVLRAAGLSWAKVKYLKNLSENVAGGDLNLETLNERGDEEVISELTKIKGIGRWTAEMFLMFSLARPDVFPLDDLGIRKAMEKLFGKKLTRDEMLKLSQSWKPYRTVASWYLWRSLEN